MSRAQTARHGGPQQVLAVGGGERRLGEQPQQQCVARLAEAPQEPGEVGAEGSPVRVRPVQLLDRLGESGGPVGAQRVQRGPRVVGAQGGAQTYPDGVVIPHAGSIGHERAELAGCWGYIADGQRTNHH
ncbi:hypothetical protein ACFTWD_31720 [Streptomyces sp. NPDC056943]|uniref:hypothetical protein n=1 Tax=Streptomyces sp. NPDC056943 TaxID=3345971 RepID=UPI00362DA99E